MSKYGIVMCSVKIDGDTANHRNLRLTSVALAPTMAPENNNNTEADGAATASPGEVNK